jgi:protein TonB
MEPVMALSDFMPYGAPELLEGASPRMARATFTASGVVAALVCCAGVLANMARVAPPPVIDVPPILYDIKHYVLQPPPGDSPMVPQVKPSTGDFHPVADETTVLPTDADVPPIAPDSPIVGGEPDGIQAHAGEGPGPVVDPLPTDYVYTDELPQLVRGAKPVYPDIAREAGVEGTVKLQLLVGLDGHVMRAIVRPHGSVPMLDEAAIAAAIQCMFTPAFANHRPVKVWVTQDYRFTLH